MRVRLLRNIGGRPDLQEGEEADLDDGLANDLCRRNLAEVVEGGELESSVELEAVPPELEITTPRKRRRRTNSKG